jgi:threonyl-tRNA synthetase
MTIFAFLNYQTMIKITLPDGSVKEFALGVTPMDVASISEGFARNVISASFNGTTVETTTSLTADGSLILYTWNDENGKKLFWHSICVMAQVLEQMYPGVKLTLGPAISNGSTMISILKIKNYRS